MISHCIPDRRDWPKKEPGSLIMFIIKGDGARVDLILLVSPLLGRPEKCYLRWVAWGGPLTGLNFFEATIVLDPQRRAEKIRIYCGLICRRPFGTRVTDEI